MVAQSANIHLPKWKTESKNSKLVKLIQKLRQKKKKDLNSNNIIKKNKETENAQLDHAKTTSKKRQCNFFSFSSIHCLQNAFLWPLIWVVLWL